MSDMPRGRPQQVTDKEIIEIARETKGPSFTAPEIAKESPIGPETMRGRLDDLVKAGVLRMKMPSSEKIYWIPSADGATGNQTGVTP
jgi:predicted ArsR family transcriptional regulator